MWSVQDDVVVQTLPSNRADESLGVRILPWTLRCSQNLLHNGPVILDPGDGESSTCRVTADPIVIALGSVPKLHGIPGVQEYSLRIKSIGDAAAIRNQDLTWPARESRQSNPVIRREILTFVVGGAGYPAFEIMAAINDLLRESVQHCPSVPPEEIRTVLPSRATDCWPSCVRIS